MDSKVDNTDKLHKIAVVLEKIYLASGGITIGLLAFMTIFTVVMRYFFSLNWKQVAEFNVVLFAFSTFWGLGYCILKNEHVVIDAIYNKLSPKMQFIMSEIDYVVVLCVLIALVKFGIDYTKLAGVQLSLGMRIPMYYIYGIIPITGAVCFICVVIRMIETWKEGIKLWQ